MASQVASGSFQGAVAVHDAKSGKETTRTPGDGGYGQSQFAFHPNGKVLASGDHRRTVRLWAIPGGKVLKRLRGHRRSVIEDLAFSADGELLASADEADVRVWNVRTGKAIGVARIGTYCVAFSPDGKRLAVGGNGEAWILDIGRWRSRRSERRRCRRGLAARGDRRSSDDDAPRSCSPIC